MSSPSLKNIKLLRDENGLEVALSSGETALLTAEFLRVHSPSAEVRGHGIGPGTLQTGKRWVKLTDLEPVGRYGVKLVFDDGHSTGIYSWDTLIAFALTHATLWQQYLDRLEQEGGAREPVDRVKWIHPPSKK